MNSQLNNTVYLIKNLFTAQTGGQQSIKNAAVVVVDGHFEWVGEKTKLPKHYQSAPYKHKIIGEGWVTPGLIDCHSHIVYGGNRANEFKQRLEGASYQEIAEQGGGILSTVKATREATEACLFSSAAKRLTSLLKEGVTTVEIKSGYGLNTETELKMLRVARRLGRELPVDVCTSFLAAHALPPEFKNDAHGYIDHICEDMLPRVMDEKLADALDAFCENIGFSSVQVEQLFQAAKRYNLPIKLHSEQLSNQHGAKLAASYHALSADHLEYLDESAVEMMAKNDTVAVLLPGAFYYLQETQLPPIAQLRKHKVPIAIATDNNPGSSPCNSLLLMLNMACTQFKMTTSEALMGVTANAAKALGIADKVGQIKEGLQADFVQWDIQEPEDLAYYFGRNPCQMVIRKGQKTSF